MKARPTFPEEFNLAEYYLFDRLREDVGDKAAILFGERRQTYAEVAEKSRDRLSSGVQLDRTDGHGPRYGAAMSRISRCGRSSGTRMPSDGWPIM